MTSVTVTLYHYFPLGKIKKKNVKTRPEML